MSPTPTSTKLRASMPAEARVVPAAASIAKAASIRHIRIHLNLALRFIIECILPLILPKGMYPPLRYIRDTSKIQFILHLRCMANKIHHDTIEIQGIHQDTQQDTYIDPISTPTSCYAWMRAWATPSPPAELPQTHAGYMRDTCGIHYENIIKVTLEALKIHARYIRDTFGIHDAIHVSHSNAIQQEMYLTCRRHAGCMRDTAAVPNCRL